MQKVTHGISLHLLFFHFVSRSLFPLSFFLKKGLQSASNHGTAVVRFFSLAKWSLLTKARGASSGGVHIISDGHGSCECPVFSTQLLGPNGQGVPGRA